MIVVFLLLETSFGLLWCTLWIFVVALRIVVVSFVWLFVGSFVWCLRFAGCEFVFSWLVWWLAYCLWFCDRFCLVLSRLLGFPFVRVL